MLIIEILTWPDTDRFQVSTWSDYRLQKIVMDYLKSQIPDILLGFGTSRISYIQ